MCGTILRLLYFLQNDPAVPERFRDEARQWGWCADELVENGHFPEQLYVREARRMIGRHVFTEHDTCARRRAVRHAHRRDRDGRLWSNCHGTPPFSAKCAATPAACPRDAQIGSRRSTQNPEGSRTRDCSEVTSDRDRTDDRDRTERSGRALAALRAFPVSRAGEPRHGEQ